MDRKYYKRLQEIKKFSDDSNTQTCAIIVNKDGEIISEGTNILPPFVKKDNVRTTRPKKYDWIVHAEVDAISVAACLGHSTFGCTMYMEWFPCNKCMATILCAGITKLVCQKPNVDDPYWGESFKIALQMAEENGIEIEYY